MNKFEELVNDFTLMGDDNAVIFSSYDRFVEFIEEIVVDERKREREACAKVCDVMEEKAEGTECCKWPTPVDCAEAIRARGDT